MAEDYYQTLGVSRSASQADIQKAYRELARKYHPDLNPDDKTAKKKFQQVQAAFDVLNNPEKREMYDRYGSSFETMGSGGPQGPYTWTYAPGGSGGPGGMGEEFDFSQFFGERFGGESPGGFSDIFTQFRKSAGKARGGAARRGGDLQQEVHIPFATSVLGGEMQVSLARPNGSTEKLSVKIPAGIEDGKKIRLRGQGESTRGGTAGDLLLTIRVDPHPAFQRQGNNLLVRVPLTIGEAAAGAKVDVPTPQGAVTLTIPPGTSGGSKLRVKGQGVSPKNGTAGDLIAEVQIVLPKSLTPEDQKLLREVDARYPSDPRANLRW
ncbi:MAG: DnaJ C-terminal domain-containing protein, partial [Planctomycetota bacterium]